MEDESTATGTKASAGWESLPTACILAAVAGLVAAVTGLFAGIALAVEHTPGTCHGDTSDYSCTIHPHGAEGIAIAMISVSVGAVVVLLIYLLGLSATRR